MSRFGDLLGSVAGKVLGGGNSTQDGSGGMMGTILGLFGSPQKGGLSALLEQFNLKGLGDIASTWVGTGQNADISEEQLESVLGSEKLGALAEKFGLSKSGVLSHLKTMLPDLIDKMTPHGKVPEDQ